MIDHLFTGNEWIVWESSPKLDHLWFSLFFFLFLLKKKKKEKKEKKRKNIHLAYFPAILRIHVYCNLVHTI